MVAMYEHDIIFFSLPLCPKCKVVAGHLEAIRRERPEISVREANILTNIGLARKHGLLTIPSLLVRGRPLRGVVTKEEIVEALD